SAPSLCKGATLIQSSTFVVTGNTLTYTTHSCGVVSRRGLLDWPPLCYLLGTCKPPPPDAPPPAPKDVCNNSCSLSCTNVTGILPPISDDCQTIANSISILQNIQSPTFTVDPGHVDTLSFQTCNMFFENVSPSTLEYCWSSLATNGIAAGGNCFPPNQPFFSEGLCTATDGTWAVGCVVFSLDTIFRY
ncbi:hypothetical protein BU17DRAFT_56119, partial [Hysterangium stoloniferum]